MPSRPLPTRVRSIVQRRARGVCEYCRARSDYSNANFTIDHIVPRSRGGTDDPNNLAFSCPDCNSFKQKATDAVDPLTGESAPLFDPRVDVWTDHFRWTPDFLHIEGVTPTGRATAARLRFDREGAVNLRVLLRAVGLHPPDDPAAGT